MSDWIKSARRLMEEIEAYSPENWPLLDNAAKLPGELDALAEQVDRLVSIEHSVPLSESDLARQLDQTRQLGIDYRQIAIRVEDLRHRQDELQELEVKAQDSLSDLQKNLGQIRLIASSNQFLAGIALSEMDLLVRDTQKLSAELNQRRSGSVEKKFRQAAALDERATASATRWMGMLNKENQLLLKELAQAVGELDLIARLEDASVASVHKLLSSETAFAISKPASQTRLSLQELDPGIQAAQQLLAGM